MNNLKSPVANRQSKITWLLAWGVHLYTALGLVAAAAIAILIIRGGEGSFRWAFLLMVVATLIDATDGTLARRIRIKEVLPGFDGRRLDDLVDFLTYTCLPLLLIWRACILPAGHEWWLLVPLLASAYGFCQVSAKTDDGYFLGFPSFWNLVAFYLYVLRPEGWCAILLLVGLSLLTFVPTRYLYPSQRGRLNRFTNVLAVVWTAMIVWVMFRLPSGSPGSDPAEELTRMLTLLEAPALEAESPGPVIDKGTLRLTLLSLFFPVYYMTASWFISLRVWRLRRRSGNKVRTALS
jgi:phosphatidylcholine synthase